MYCGLSPLARGTRAKIQNKREYFRFIPAGAGNTTRRRPRSVASTVYPRWRGEHMANLVSREFSDGLSPLARGTLRQDCYNAGTGRFIPAGAGNTPSSLGLVVVRSVYPRWRGEHSDKSSSVQNSGGLSPLARGTHKSESSARYPHRFIPAGAGNTPTTIHPGLNDAVYPRWRGEHTLEVYRFTLGFGLSPLARGTHVPC